MIRDADTPRVQRAQLLALLGLAIFAPVLAGFTGGGVLPAWIMPVVSLIALTGALLLFWRAGALKGTYLALFLLVLVAAFSLGQLNT